MKNREKCLNFYKINRSRFTSPSSPRVDNVMLFNGDHFKRLAKMIEGAHTKTVGSFVIYVYDIV